MRVSHKRAPERPDTVEVNPRHPTWETWCPRRQRRIGNLHYLLISKTLTLRPFIVGNVEEKKPLLTIMRL